MSYHYDVFISYRRQRFRDLWITEHFLPRLKEHLEEELQAQCKKDLEKIFFDQASISAGIREGMPHGSGIEPGAFWQTSLKEAILQSRCMIALFSPTYFRSQWCNIEWQSFLARQSKSKVPIVIPISVFAMDKLPKEAMQYNVIKMDEFVIDGPSLISSRQFVEFNHTLKLVAERVASAVCGAPAFELWPIIDKVALPKIEDAEVARF